MDHFHGSVDACCLQVYSALWSCLSLMPILLLDTDEELKEWQMKFEERIALLETKISKLEREMNDEETKSSLLLQTINDTTREIGKLQAEADVCFQDSI